MCGTCGQYDFGNPEPVERRDIEAMTKTLMHRGPDDEGYYIAGPMAALRVLTFDDWMKHKIDFKVRNKV